MSDLLEDHISLNQLGAPASIILIAFEDPDIILELKKRFPDSEINLVTKKQIAGKSVSKLARELRARKYDAVVVSDCNATVFRSKTSLQLLASSIRARRIIILYSDNTFVMSCRAKLVMTVFLRLFPGVIASLFLLARAWLSIFRWGIGPGKRTVPAPGNQPHNIAYFRTDLSGGVKAGGSISHMLGFLDGARTLGSRVFLVADAEIAGCRERNIPVNIVQPSALFDFLDELQIMSYHFRMIKAASKIFSREKPDMIYHRHSIFNFSSIVLGHKFNIPVVLEVNYSEVWAKKNWSRLIFERIAVAFERVAFKYADLIVVVSEVVKQDIIALGAGEPKIIVNPNAADPETFSPKVNGAAIREKLGLDDAKNTIVGFIGTFTRWHGVEILMDAIKDVCSSRKDICFLLIGDGNLKSNLELEVTSSHLEGQVIFTGLIPHVEAPKYLAACDILVSPHLGFEDGTRFFGSPTKLFEYMAMGKAIIASDLEQIGSIIKDGVNGILTKPGDAEELAEKIQRLADDPELRRKLGAQARQDAMDKYTWKQNALRVFDALRNISGTGN